MVIPQAGVDLSYTCPVGPEVGWLEGRSFQSVISRLPIKSGGLGLRSMLDLSPAAWFGALEQAVPFFAGEKQVCPPLAHLAGLEEGVVLWGVSWATHLKLKTCTLIVSHITG